MTTPTYAPLPILHFFHGGQSDDETQSHQTEGGKP